MRNFIKPDLIIFHDYLHFNGGSILITLLNQVIFNISAAWGLTPRLHKHFALILTSQSSFLLHGLSISTYLIFNFQLPEFPFISFTFIKNTFHNTVFSR